MASIKTAATLIACLVQIAVGEAAHQPLVHTFRATYKGTHLDSAVDGYLGIPYAEPPVGPLRFAPPQPIIITRPYAAPKRLVDATAFGPVCHQFHYRTVLGDNLIESTGQSEDCLTLNVFVPRHRSRSGNKKQLLPVYVWSHGGAFGEGGGSVPCRFLRSGSTFAWPLHYFTLRMALANNPIIDETQCSTLQASLKAAGISLS
jgi:hypothetical protein